METKAKILILSSLSLSLLACAKGPQQGLDKVLVPNAQVLSSQSSLTEESAKLNQYLDEARSSQENQTPLKKSQIAEKLLSLNLPEYPRALSNKTLPPPPPEPAKEVKEKPPINFQALVGVKDPVSLQVENMPLNDFIIYTLGELLKVNFLIDEEVMKMNRPVTLRISQPHPPVELLQAVVAFLEEKHELEVSAKGNVLNIIKPKPKPAPPPPKGADQIILGDTLPNTSARVAYFHPLKFIRFTDIDWLLKDLLKGGVSVEMKNYPRENAILLIGPANHIRPVIEVVSLLDIPLFTGKTMYIYKVTYWQPEEFQRELTNLLTKLGFPIANSLKDPGIFFLPLRTLNALLLAFPDQSSGDFVLEWIKKLDSPESAGSELRFYTYKPRYSKASDLAEALGRFLSAQLAQTAQPQAQPPAPATPQGTPSPRQPRAITFALPQGIAISSDERRNLLLITATPALYQQILKALQDLDIPPRQVLIEATIMELTLKDELKFGLEWFIRNTLTGGNYTLGQIFGVPTAPGLTFTMVTDTGSFNLLINLFAAKGLTNILSTPKLLVLDNQQATIQVGTDVPVIVGEVTPAQAAGTPGVIRSYQYRNTGVILNVRPTIYTEGLLQLDITQEVSEMGTSPPGVNSPTILIRKINTTVVAEDSQTIVLGGLISTNKSTSENKLPLLGDIPLLGNLFKSQAKEERKTELLVLLKPKIVKDTQVAVNLTQELMDQLKWLREK